MRNSCDSGAAAPSAVSTSVRSAVAGRLAVANTVDAVPLKFKGTSNGSHGAREAITASSLAVSLVQRRMSSSLPMTFSARATSAASGCSSSTTSRRASGSGFSSPPFAGAYLSISFSASVIAARSARSELSSPLEHRVRDSNSPPSSSLGSLTSTQPRSSKSLSRALRSEAMTARRSFFIFTIAISAVHYPFHNERRGLVHARVGPRAHRGLPVLRVRSQSNRVLLRLFIRFGPQFSHL